MLGSSVGDVVWVVGDGDGVGVTGGAVGSGVNGGGGGNVCHDASERPSSCGKSAMSGKELVSSLGGCRCRLRFSGGAGRDGLIIYPAPSPAAPTAAFLDAVRIRRAAAAAFVVAAGASVAVEAATAA